MSTVEPFRSNLDMFRFVWRLLSKAERQELVWLQLLVFAMVFSTLGGIAAIIPFFSVLADPQSLAHHAGLERLYEWLSFGERQTFVVFLGCAFIVIVVIGNAINLFGMLAINRFALRVGREFHVGLFAEYLHRDYLFHARGGAVTLLNNVIFEATRVATGIIQGGLTLIASLLASMLIIATVVVLNPLLAIGAAALFGGAYGAIYLLSHSRLGRYGHLEAELWDGRIRTLTESFGSIKEVLVRGNQDYFRDAFAARCDAMARIGGRTFAITNTPRYILDTVTAAGLVGAALWLNRGAGAAQWLAELSFLGFAAYRLLPAMQQAFAALARIRSDRAAFQRIAGDLQRARLRERPRAPPEHQLVQWRGRPRDAIRVREACFRYSPGDALAIRKATLDIPAGSSVGFVGLNGSGKTTMSDLLLGLLEPESGQIEIDDVALTEHNRCLWQATVAYVPQNVFLLDATILDNIAFGVPADEVDLRRVQEAAHAARLDDFVAALPGGLQYKLGERGTRLSGGQRQRLGIARALYRQASFLVLDEATNALDGLAEQDIVATIESLRSHVTVLLIAHRMSSVRSCDLIFEFEAGTIVGCGSYETLRRDSSRFRALAGGA